MEKVIPLGVEMGRRACARGRRGAERQDPPIRRSNT